MSTTETRTTSGGAYYSTAVDLRRDAKTCKTNYAPALGKAAETGKPEDLQHAQALIDQAVGFEIAAALQCVAQAIEDSRPRPLTHGWEPASE